jgi:hypothetical protein
LVRLWPAAAAASAAAPATSAAAAAAAASAAYFWVSSMHLVSNSVCPRYSNGLKSRMSQPFLRLQHALRFQIFRWSQIAFVSGINILSACFWVSCIYMVSKIVCLSVHIVSSCLRVSRIHLVSNSVCLKHSYGLSRLPQASVRFHMC